MFFGSKQKSLFRHIFAYVAEMGWGDAHFFFEGGMESLPVSEAAHFADGFNLVIAVFGIVQQSNGFADTVAVDKRGEVHIETFVDGVRKRVLVGACGFGQLVDIQFGIEI